jgi:hypothetical protein
MGVLRDEDLAPDGVLLVVHWDAMKVGDSIFVPCINTTSAIKTARIVFNRRGWHIRLKIGAHNHIWGVRIWRSA